MFTIVQEETNKIQIFEDVNFTHLLIVFTYNQLEVVGIFENKISNCPYYEIDIVEVGENGIVDNENGQIKLSPQTTWVGTVYGQNSDTNLFPQNATLIDSYNFQVKGTNANTYPIISPQIDCLPATAIVKDQEGNILATESIPSGGSEDITVSGGQEPLDTTDDLQEGSINLYFTDERAIEALSTDNATARDNLDVYSRNEINSLIKQTIKILDVSETFEFTQANNFRINSINVEAGVTVTIKLSDGTTDYTLGDTITAFDYLIFSVDIIGAFEVNGELL